MDQTERIMEHTKKKIAVIGGGVSGISACLLLEHKYDVSLFEKNDYVGGHTNTVQVNDRVAVDTGFIVCNNRTYPHFHKMLKKLDVKVRNTCMSFGYYDEYTGFQYAGTDLNGLLAQRSNLFNVGFWKMTKDVVRFSFLGLNVLKNGADLNGMSLGEFLKKHRFNREFIMNYLVPIGGAIWSSSNEDMLNFPADLFLHFFKNHGLLNLFDRPTWQTVEGGSQTYVKKFQSVFTGNIYTEAKICEVRRSPAQSEVVLDNGGIHSFDAVIFATHADQVIPLLAEPSSEEKEAFSSWNYLKNHVVLHTDTAVMPPLRRAWASWNFVNEKGSSRENPVSVTYDMNRLQGLDEKEEYFVSLNRLKPVDSARVIKEIHYEHPNFTVDSLASRNKILALNGKSNTYYVGSYFGYGFHEDAVKSSVDLVNTHFDIDGF